MYITKFALKNISRSRARNILIGIIVVIIAFAVCISLCIRQAAEDSKNETMEDINITAQISPDREAAMENVMAGGMPGEFDKDALADMMGEALTLEELQVYTEADAVKSFYYTMTAYMNGSGEFEAYSTGGSDDESGGMMGFPGGMSMGGMSSGDFTVTGFSSDESMTEFVDGTCEITEGAVFDENTSEMVCIIPDELADYNSFEVGSEITVCAADDDSEQYTLKIVGIYSNSQSSAQAMGMGGFGGMMSDPANNIYMSYAALEAIVSGSDNIDASVTGTYVLGSMEAYESFQKEVKELGLSDEYVVSSADLESYERMTQPLESLAKFTGYFLIVVLAVGAVILIVLNVFATRERKYEIGVLTAIGMKKKQVARLFLTEILAVTLAGVIIGGGIGAATSVPVADAMMNIVSQQSIEKDMGQGFGRDFNAPPDMSGGMFGGDMGDAPQLPEGFENMDGAFGEMAGFVTDISASVDLTVLLEMMGICLLLALAAGMVSVVTIMRYEPLQILSNRD